MGRTPSISHPGQLLNRGHIYDLLIKNWVVLLMEVVVREFNEFREIRDVSEFSVCSLNPLPTSHKQKGPKSHRSLVLLLFMSVRL